METETKKTGKEIMRQRKQSVNKRSLGFWVDVIISWSLLYVQNQGYEHARVGKLIRGWRRWWCLFLYWLAGRLSRYRNYDDIES